MAIYCARCGKETDLPKTRWIKKEIVMDEDDNSCVRTTVYCDECVKL